MFTNVVLIASAVVEPVVERWIPPNRKLMLGTTTVDDDASQC